MPKVSVLIPVYNTEKQIAICLQSVLDQTYSDFEIIVINDGSTDHSEEKIQAYRQKNPDRIHYYAKPNEGIASTRNEAIQKATGEYFLFLDSDDYLQKDLLVKLIPYMEQQIDLIKFKLTMVDQQLQEIQKVDGPVFSQKTGEEAFHILFGQDVLMDSPCLYLVRKDYFEQHHFRFADGKEHEDFGLIPLMLIQAKSVVSTNEYGYFYIQSDNSIMRNPDHAKTIKKMEDSFAHYDAMIEAMKKSQVSKRGKEDIKIFYTNSILLKIKQLAKEDQKNYRREFQKRKMYRNIKIRNGKQFVKRILLTIALPFYLKK